MDAGDIDQDGDLDLLLGSFNLEAISSRNPNIMGIWIEKGIPFVLLENLTFYSIATHQIA